MTLSVVVVGVLVLVLLCSVASLVWVWREADTAEAVDRA